jgi:uncharacterized membrane protein
MMTDRKGQNMNRHQLLSLVAILLAVFAVLSFLTIDRHFNFAPIPEADCFVQTFFNWSQGRGPTNTTEGHHFGVHFSPIMYLLKPFLFVIPADADAISIFLLLVNAFVVVILGGFAVYRYAEDRWKDRRSAAWLCFIYLASPAIHGQVFAGYHPLIAALPLVILFWWQAEKQNMAAAAILLVLVLAVRQDVALAASMIGILLLIKKPRKLGFAVLAVSVLWLVVSIKLLLPLFASYGDGVSTHLLNRYDKVFGDSLASYAAAYFAHPLQVFQLATGPARMHYLVGLFKLFGPIPLLGAGCLLIAAPNTMVNLTANYEGQYSLTTHYQVILVAAIFICLIVGLAGRFAAWRGIFLVALTVGSIIGIVNNHTIYERYDSTWRAVQFNWPAFDVAEKEFLGNLKGAVSPEAIVAGSRSLGAHFAAREHYLGTLLNIKMLQEVDFDMIILDQEVKLPPGTNVADQLTRLLNNSGKYRLATSSAGGRLLIFIKVAPNPISSG